MISTSYSPSRRIGLLLGPLLLCYTLISAPPEGMPVLAWYGAGMGALMAVWWMTEAIPLSVTALLPVALIPLLGIGHVKLAAAPYASPAIFLYLGGFMIAAAMERWNLHRRIALHIVYRVGTRSHHVIGGFMVATALLSMWISNTATTMMMIPIALSVIAFLMEEKDAIRDPAMNMFATALVLGIAYAASIGGIATLVGTPPNAVLKGFMHEAHNVDLAFTDWLIVGLPFSMIMLVLTWLVVTRGVFRLQNVTLPGHTSLIAAEIAKLGPMSRGEKLTSLMFALTALGWVFRSVIADYIPLISDAGIAIIGATLCFLIPVDLKRGEFVLSWKEVERIPWGVLLLLGGGLSLAATLSHTGFAHWMGQALSTYSDLPTWLFVLAIAAVIIFLTELMSNVATVTAFLPIIAAVSVGIGQDPLLMVIPATIAASCAFMMPVATPPNAIAFASGYISMHQMVRAGLVLNLIGIALLLPFAIYVIPLVWG